MTEDRAPYSDLIKADYEARRSEFLERLRYQQEFAQSAFKSLMVVNGGAILALLTFIGNKGSQFDHGIMRAGFGCFGVGILLALLAYFGAYFSQAAFMEIAVYQMSNAQHQIARVDPPFDVNPIHRRGTILVGLAALVSFMSLVAFAAGSYCTLQALL